jgi:hypothetical protein
VDERGRHQHAVHRVLAAELPKVVERLKTAWEKWADRCGVLPLPIKRK